MNGNVVGEEFDEFVAKQIELRQSNQFGGYGTSLRTDDQLQYLTNRNAWVKLASSVDVLEGDTILPFTQVDSSGQTTPSSPNSTPLGGINVGTGGVVGSINNILSTQVVNLKSDKLRKIGIENPENYPGSKLAESAILFNALSSFNPSTNSYSTPRAGISNNKNLWNNAFAYGLGGTDYGIQPPPGITGATIDSINRGSIRKANVTLKAHNKFQFDIIELLYLRLGFTMMLEWGWDKYLDNETGTIQQVGNTIIEEKWFTSTGISQLKMLGYIQEMRSRYDGNYDGFFGKVSNFTWNFNPDGTYDISIDLITVGDVVESLKVNTFSKAGFATDTAAINKVDARFKLEDTNIAKAATLNSIGYYLYKKVEEISTNGTTPTPGLVRLKDASDSTLYVQLTPSPNSSVGNQYYVRLGEFLSQLENLVVPIIQNDGQTQSPQINISHLVDENLISYFPNQISLDPKVCIHYPFLNVYGDITGINYPEYLTYLDQYVTVKSTGESYGLLMNLYINFEFISGLLAANGGPDQELSLYKFLQDICNGINNALGGINKLEPIVKNDYIVTIIDQTLSIPLPNIVNLEVYGYNPKNQTSNFVKDIKFVSKITPQLASMVSIGATAAGSSTSEIDGTAFSKWNEGLVDRFTKEILEPDGLIQLNASSSIDRTKYENEFNLFPDAIGVVTRTFMRVIRIFTPLNGVGYLGPTLKVVNDPYYDTIFGQVMDFEKFYASAIEIEKRKTQKGFYRRGDIKNLVDKNYSIYLVNAFGGKLQNVQIQERQVTRTGGRGRSAVYTSKFVTVPLEVKTPQYFEYNDTFISQGKSAYQNYINMINNERFRIENIPSSEIGFIPLSFDLILDGISGVKIYNKLNINNTFLPSNYPESLNFIITKVNHNISNNSWDTSLSTISIPKTEPYKFSTTPVPNNTGNASGGSGAEGSSREGATKFPEVPFLDPAPSGNTWLFKDAKKTINSLVSDVNFAKTIFAMIWMESTKINSKDPNTGAFISAGGHNYTGTQTDNARWGKGNPFIIGRFIKNDANGPREFAAFSSNESQIEFLKAVLVPKGFDKAKNANEWAERYLNSWNFLNLSTNNKPEYDRLFPGKKDVYVTAINMWNQLK